MADSSNKKENAHFFTEQGKLDVAKLLETNPNLLASFMHQREDTDGEGEGGGEGQHVSLSFAIGMAALRDALGLSMSYVPLNNADQVREMSLSAQFNLGLEAAQGLSMDLGLGSSSNPFGSADDTPAEKKDTEAYRKKVKGQ